MSQGTVSKFALELGVSNKNGTTVHVADVGVFDNLKDALISARQVRGVLVRDLNAGEVDIIEPGYVNYEITGVTVEEFNDDYGTVWTFDLY